MATTPNYSFSVYSSTDTDVRFLDFRVATAGSQSTSNFYVIDTVLKQHSDAIDSINATPSAFVVKGTYSAGSLYTASVANYPGYKNEQLIVLSLNQKNTGAVQININGTTNKDVMKYGSDGVLKAVEAGDFVANSPVLCLYDGTRFVVIGITSASSITVTGEAGDILQIADDGTIESSGKKAAQPNGIATLDENGNVVQVANMANSAAAVYDGEPVSVEYVGQNRIASITAYGENAQGGTTEAPVAIYGVESVHVTGRNLGNFRLLTNRAVDVHNFTTYVAVGYYATEKPVIVHENVTYRLSSAGVSYFAGNLHFKNKKGKTISQLFEFNSFTVPNGTYYIMFTLASNTITNPDAPIMLNLGNTALPYEPYRGSVTPLPIPRPLRRVGNVKDKCVTQVKSVYDKRVVLDGSENWLIANGVFYSAGTVTDNALTMAACDRYKFHITDNGTSGVTTDKTFAFNIATPERIMIRDDDYTSIKEFKAHLTDNPLTVYYQSTAYNGTNGLDVCLTEYMTGFVELDGTETNLQYFDKYGILVIKGILTAGSTTETNVFGVCLSSHFAMVKPGTASTGDNIIFSQPRLSQLVIQTSIWDSLETAKAYLAAQKEAGTPVQVAYQLAAPETYATDPVDFDNAAGPVTVVTGGQVEVKMTDFVTDRTPAFLNKLDKTGDGSDVTVTFTEAATDTDIASGDKLSILFGKILKRFTNILNGTTKVGYATKADTDNLGNQITETYANSLDVADNTIVLKNKIGENLSTITVPYANSAGNVATSIKEMGIAVQTASPYAWFLNYTGSGNKDGARKYYASVYADNATYSTSAGSSNNIVIYNNNWSGTDGSISAVYANAEKTYVNLSSSNAAGTAWPNISVQRINGHVLNMALNGTSLSITW